MQDAISAQEGHDLTGSKLYVTEDTMAIKTDGTPRTITVAFEKAVDVLGLTADIVLPEGLSYRRERQRLVRGRQQYAAGRYNHVERAG